MREILVEQIVATDVGREEMRRQDHPQPNEQQTESIGQSQFPCQIENGEHGANAGKHMRRKENRLDIAFVCQQPQYKPYCRREVLQGRVKLVGLELRQAVQRKHKGHMKDVVRYAELEACICKRNRRHDDGEEPDNGDWAGFTRQESSRQFHSHLPATAAGASMCATEFEHPSASALMRATCLAQSSSPARASAPAESRSYRAPFWASCSIASAIRVMMPVSSRPWLRTTQPLASVTISAGPPKSSGPQ
jgi:hypothetical protein